MNSTTTAWTAQTPSGFAMPTAGHAIASSPCRHASVVTAGAVRERRVPARTLAADVVWAGYRADLDLAKAYFPGTSAWRPPIC
jgi:hypothetical protein